MVVENDDKLCVITRAALYSSRFTLVTCEKPPLLHHATSGGCSLPEIAGRKSERGIRFQRNLCRENRRCLAAHRLVDTIL